MDKPELASNWKTILTKAWSIRFILLAGFFTAAEITLPLLSNKIPEGGFALATFFAVAGAFISRIVAQRGL
jgi:hypothetical protein